MTKRTLKDLILNGRYDHDFYIGTGLKGTTCTDTGAFVTVRVPQGIKGEHSKEKGERYVIQDLLESAPWNPNTRKATLQICYSKAPQEIVFTYLEERFNDEVE